MGGVGVMHLRGSESIPRPVPATFHWLHSSRSENNHRLQKITTENNTHTGLSSCEPEVMVQHYCHNQPEHIWEDCLELSGTRCIFEV